MVDINKILNIFGLGTFTKTLIAFTILLSVLYLLLLISVTRKGKYGTNTANYDNFIKNVGRIICIISTFIPICSLIPFNSINRTLVFFILNGIVAGLAMLYLALGGRKLAPILFSTTVVLLTVITSIYIKNLLYPRYDFRTTPLYIMGNIAEYQRQAIEEGFYYFIHIDSLTMVPLGMATNMGPELLILYKSGEMLVTMLPLIVFARRLSLSRGIAGLYLVFVPSLSFLTGRILSLPYTSTAIALIALMFAGMFTINEILLYILVITVAVFAHPGRTVCLNSHALSRISFFENIY